MSNTQASRVRTCGSKALLNQGQPGSREYAGNQRRWGSAPPFPGKARYRRSEGHPYQTKGLAQEQEQDLAEDQCVGAPASKKPRSAPPEPERPIAAEPVGMSAPMPG
jgi:hypothetical protein